jgi:hypothetical protein
MANIRIPPTGKENEELKRSLDQLKRKPKTGAPKAVSDAKQKRNKQIQQHANRFNTDAQNINKQAQEKKNAGLFQQAAKLKQQAAKLKKKAEQQKRTAGKQVDADKLVAQSRKLEDQVEQLKKKAVQQLAKAAAQQQVAKAAAKAAAQQQVAKAAQAKKKLLEQLNTPSTRKNVLTTAFISPKLFNDVLDEIHLLPSRKDNTEVLNEKLLRILGEDNKEVVDALMQNLHDNYNDFNYFLKKIKERVKKGEKLTKQVLIRQKLIFPRAQAAQAAQAAQQAANNTAINVNGSQQQKKQAARKKLCQMLEDNSKKIPSYTFGVRQQGLTNQQPWGIRTQPISTNPKVKPQIKRRASF